MSKFKALFGGSPKVAALPPQPAPLPPPVQLAQVETIEEKPEDLRKKTKAGGKTQLTSPKRLTGGRDADALGGGGIITRPGDFGTEDQLGSS